MNSLDRAPEPQQPGPYYERDCAMIASAFWPARLIELALARGLAEHRLLRHTGIFCEDLHRPEQQISPQQLLQLIHNTEKYAATHELSFVLGHELLPGPFLALEQRLGQTANLSDLIDALIAHQALLCPLINIRRRYEGDQLVIYWQDACGAQDSLVFLMETMASAIGSYSRWLAGRALPWRFYFCHRQPSYIEQYQVHLDGECHFDCQRNAMAIAIEYCHQPWPLTAGAEPGAALLPVRAQIAPGSRGFIGEIYTYLNHNIAAAPNLEQTAAAFGMSSASLKRKLKKHHSHFQAIYDQVRKDLTLYWINQEGWSSEQVARELHFHDVANLRRAFKKWTGLTLLAVRS